MLPRNRLRGGLAEMHQPRRRLVTLAAAAVVALVPACGGGDVENEVTDRAVPDEAQQQIDDAQKELDDAQKQFEQQTEDAQKQSEQLQKELDNQVPQAPGD